MPMTKMMVIVLTGLLNGAAQAQTASRDDLVNQVEVAIGKPASVASSSPLVTSTLTMAQKANPQVDSDTWEGVRTDTAAALTRFSSGHGSVFDVRVRGALDSFTNSELELLGSKLNDPLLLKFRNALQSEPNERKNSVLSSALQITVEVNGILAKHNLKQVPFGPTEQSK